MSSAFDSAQKVEVWDEPEESQRGETAVLAADYWGCGPEWDVDSGVLPAASPAGKPVLMVATQAESAPEERSKPAVQDRAASFALVSEDGMDMPAGLELVLRDGRRLRISQGVQEETLRAVLAAMESGNK
jgi:hypothetical protein